MMRSIRRAAGAALLTMAAAAGCASSGSSAASGSEAEKASTARNTNVIAEAELREPSIEGGDALSAVKRLRPGFLLTRGSVSGTNATAGSVQISVDGGPLVAVNQLSTMRPGELREIRYLSSSEAAQRFGTAANSGPVLLVNRR